MAKGAPKTFRIHNRMDNPIDHPIDLGLVNYVKHPNNPNYVIYRFADPERASSFEQALIEEKIWFEKGEQKGRVRLFILYGIHKSDYKKTQKINYQVEAKHKKFLIPHNGLRYLLLGISTVIMILALVGYCKQAEKLRLYDETGTLEKSSGEQNKKP